MERIAVLGSTGSIGTNGLDVIAKFPDRFKVCALSTNVNVGLLRKQARIFKPEAVCIARPNTASQFFRLKRKFDGVRKLYLLRSLIF